MKKITILLADDHSITRHGLRALLNLESDFEIIGEAVTGREAMALAEKLKPDVVVMDWAMPLLNGMEATRQLTSICPDTKIIILSAYDDNEHVTRAIASGAAGYLLKLTAAKDLIEAIHEVHKGNAYFSPQIACRLQEDPNPASWTDKRRSNGLSVREAEVLQLIAEGFLNKQMADELHLSVKTIEKHRQSLMHKLDLHCTADLVRHAAAKGVVEACNMRTILNPA